MFNLANFEKLFTASMRSVAMNALQAAGDQVMAELGKDDPWSMPAAEALQFVRDRDNKLSGVPQDVFDRIRGRIEEGLTQGQTLTDIAKGVRAEFNDLSDRRARTIASTETSAAYGFGRHEAMKSAGVQWKRWVTSGNSNVRAAHRVMNDVVVAFDEVFTVLDPKTGDFDQVKHPGDADGAPWNVINCHCVAVATAKGPEGEVEPAQAEE
jgi:uncharacterized protein with gpF-like domain